MGKENEKWEKGATFVPLSAPQPLRKPRTRSFSTCPRAGVAPGDDAGHAAERAFNPSSSHELSFAIFNATKSGVWAKIMFILNTRPEPQ